MKIDRTNYEVFFLDYIEGNLSPEMVEELQIFLALNPDLDEELRGLDQSVLSYSDEVYDQKELLKKSELPFTQEELDDLLLMEFDGVASSDVVAKLDKWSSKFPVVAAQRSAMMKARFVPDAETFEFKSLLRFDQTPDMAQTDMLLAGATEGDLQAHEQNELNRRIESDSTIAASLDQMNRARIVSDTTSFEHKEEVQIPETLDFSDIRNLMIAKVEGDLTREQNERLSAALSSDVALQEELRRFYQARLTPETVVFEGKDDLRRKEAVVIPLRRILSIATSIAAVFVLVFWITSNNTTHTGEVAGTHEPDTQWNNTTKQNNETSPSESTPADNEKEVVAPEVIREQHIAPDELAFEQAPVIAPSDDQEDAPRKTSPIPTIKTLHAPENAFAFSDRKELAIPSPDMSVIHDDTQTAQANTTLPTAQSQEPATIWQLLGEAAEERLEKTAAYALVERQVEKVTPTERDRFKLERIDKEDKSQLRMKLGKLEVSRDTKKRPASKGRLERIIDRFVKE